MAKKSDYHLQSSTVVLLRHFILVVLLKTTSLSELASQVGLLINSTKTKILETLTSPNTITLNGNDIEKVNNFTYLGSYISNDGNIIKEVKIRIAKAAAIFRKLNTIWKSNNISRNLKLKIFNSNVITSLSYESECWYSTKAIEEKRITFENKCLRKIMNIR